MKVRKGFVSNSSSSSFICDLTGHVESGMDLCLSDLEMVECINGHLFAYDGLAAVEAWANSDEDDETYAEDERNTECGYALPERLCPICQKDPKAKSMIVERLKKYMKRLNVTAADIE